MRSIVFLVTIGLGGALILISLGVWQVQRLAWKEGIIAEIDARIDATPVALPAAPDPENDAYLPVEVTGDLGAEHLRVLVSRKGTGAGYRIIRPMTFNSRRIMVDMGFVSTVDARGLEFEQGARAAIIGNLQWPREVDGFTPDPDIAANIWYAREVPAMAAALGTEPVLVVRRDAEGQIGPISPMPVDTSAIPNDHLQYAITWFSLAAIWTAMTFYFMRRRPMADQD